MRTTLLRLLTATTIAGALLVATASIASAAAAPGFAGKASGAYTVRDRTGEALIIGAAVCGIGDTSQAENRVDAADIVRVREDLTWRAPSAKGSGSLTGSVSFEYCGSLASFSARDGGKVLGTFTLNRPGNRPVTGTVRGRMSPAGTVTLDLVVSGTAEWAKSVLPAGSALTATATHRKGFAAAVYVPGLIDSGFTEMTLGR